MTQYAAAAIRVIVYVAGQEVPADEVKITFPVNGLPSCTIRALPGRDIYNLLVSNAHKLQGLIIQIPLHIVVEVQGLSGSYPSTFAPVGSYLLFEGYVSGVSYSRDVTSLSMTIEGISWLYDLAFSSALSDAFHPTTPRDVTFNAFLNSRGGSAGNLIAVDEMARLITPQMVLQDLWYCLRTILLHIASLDRFAYQYFPDRVNDTSNRLTAQALSRFLVGLPPLTINTQGIGAEILANSIIVMLTHGSVEYNPLSLQGLAETTLWERLIEVLAPLFQFAVVPYPTYANVVPYTPTLGLVYTQIQPEHIFTITRAVDATKPQYATVMMANMKLMGDSDLSQDTSNTETVGFGGLYIGSESGVTSFRYAPPYTAYLSVLPMMVAGFALSANQRGNGYAFPGLAPFVPDQLRWQTAQYFQKALLDRMAQYYYTLDLLKNKQMIVTGPLRFDISPASLVQLTSLGEYFTGATDSPYRTATGYVNSVTYYFRSRRNAALAATAFELAFVRDGLQFLHPSFTVPGHPLYATYFTGSRMV